LDNLKKLLDLPQIKILLMPKKPHPSEDLKQMDSRPEHEMVPLDFVFGEKPKNDQDDKIVSS